MYRQTVTVINPSGLHARPASDFTREAARFSSDVTIRRADGGEAVNAKSIAYVLCLGAGRGTRVELAAEGGDEKAAVESLCALIESGFGEL